MPEIHKRRPEVPSGQKRIKFDSQSTGVSTARFAQSQPEHRPAPKLTERREGEHGLSQSLERRRLIVRKRPRPWTVRAEVCIGSASIVARVALRQRGESFRVPQRKSPIEDARARVRESTVDRTPPEACASPSCSRARSGPRARNASSRCVERYFPRSFLDKVVGVGIRTKF